MANSVDPDQMPHSAASDLGQHCLFWLSAQYLGLLQYFFFLHKNICCRHSLETYMFSYWNKKNNLSGYAFVWSNAVIRLQMHRLIWIISRNTFPEAWNVKTYTLGKKRIYCIYPKYWDTLTPYQKHVKVWTNPFHYLLTCLKFCFVSSSVDPDQMLHSAASDLGLLSLLRPVCPKS